MNENRERKQLLIFVAIAYGVTFLMGLLIWYGNSRELRENILKAALQEFFDKGYQSAAMRNIAEQARIPTGLIYSYYKNKDALFDAVLRPVLYDWERVLTAGGENKSKHTSSEIYGPERWH